MTYPETVDWLFSQVPNYQKQGGSAYKPGLDTISALLDRIGNPQNDIKTIHVAGTNGKGSVCHILAACLIENGYKTGLFTSPHILDFRERIKIGGQPVSEEFVVAFVEKNREHFEELQPSFFELTTAMAFTAFGEFGCDISVIETGLGGRLDSTNVIQPELSVITNISLEHTHFLGNTIPEVAAEKAGIIKKNTPVVLGNHVPESMRVMEEVALTMSAPITVFQTRSFSSDLLGSFQQENLSTAYSSLEVLNQMGWAINLEKAKVAMNNVAELTGFKGRMQKVREKPTVILDAAHNRHSFEQLLKEIQKLEFNQLHMIFAAANDKDLSMLELIPADTKLHLCSFHSKRSYSVSQLKEKADSYELFHETHSSAQEAYEQVLNLAENGDLVLVCGSFYLLEEILKLSA